MSRTGTSLLTGPDSARQRLGDALATPRGSYPFMRDYGSLVGELVDQVADRGFEARVYARVAEAVAHPPNGLEDIVLREVRVSQAGLRIEVQTLAEWIGDDGQSTPITARQELAEPRQLTDVSAQANRPATGAPGLTGTARIGETLTADAGDVADPDGPPAFATWSFQWLRDMTAIAGAISATYDPVDADVGEVLRVRVSFEDDAGHAETRTSAETLAVTLAPNQLPASRAGNDQAVAAGADVTLDGSASSDPDGSIASYLWEQTAGSTVALSDTAVAMPTFTAPSMASAQTLIFRLTVTDDRGGSATDTVDVMVAASVNQLPVSRAGNDQAVAAGADVTLDGSASSDPDGSIASYLWEQTAGSTVALSDTAVAMPTFTAPSMASVQTLTFRLTVTDDRGGSATDTVDVMVAASVNQLPVSRAGNDQAVAAGADVTLDGSASSDPDGSIASYLWEQTAGSTVALSDTAVAMPTFTAPSMASVQTLTFRLTVTDDRGGQATDTVDVAVAAAMAGVSYRFDTIENLRAFATFMEGSRDGLWEIIASGSTTSVSTGPGGNSGGPYAATDASGGSFSEIGDNSEFDLDVEASWPSATGRVLRLRLCLQGQYGDSPDEGLMVQGMVDGGSWEDIELIRGWGHNNTRTAGSTFNDYGGTERLCVLDGGWVDRDMAIPDQYAQVRLRLAASGGQAFNHDIALWSAELLNP